ncbi:MAG TPA: SDR family oxidoreductase [Dermatophilaceae bacterium]|nr:SDR family oxidoreductase [Dermatophilaceae bacterium]
MSWETRTMYSFTDRTVLITGGARGVGRAVTTRLARAGAHVVVNCFHSYGAAKTLRDQLRAEGAQVDLLRGSVARRDQVERMFAELRDLVGGRLDGLVNNAASGAFAPVYETEDAVIDRAFDTNFRGAWWCSTAARGLLAAGRHPAIVNLSSVGSALVVGNYAAVGTSKAALEALTRYLAAELAPEGIRVNTASGGLIDGEVAQLFPDAEQMAAVVRAATPLGRLGTQEELADVVAFLLSEGSRWVTGQVVVADGGLSLGAAMLSAPTRTRPRTPAQAATVTPPGMPTTVAPNADPDAVAPNADPDAVAIVGMGITVPGARDVEAFWQVLREGPELFVDSRPERWRAESFAALDRGAEDKSYQSRSAYVVDDLDDSSATEFTTRWLRHAVREALHGVGLPAPGRVGCVFGYTPDGNQHLEEVLVRDGVLADLSAVLADTGTPAPQAERLLDEVGRALTAKYPRTEVDPALVWPQEVGRRAVDGLLPGSPEVVMVDTACSSSLYALDIGVKALREGRHDAVVCGGTFAVGPRNSVLFAKLNGLSVGGTIRSMDHRSDGVLFSDGAAVLVLKRLADARRDGDDVLGFVAATGASSDGKGKAIYAPNVGGQKRAVQRAWRKAPAEARRLSFVVAHATGTPAGDLCELTALGEEIGAGREVCVTSNKSVIGHTGWAAGAASVIHVLLAMREGVIPRQHRFEALPPAATAAASLSVPTRDTAWPAGSTGRVAAVSGFGFGGTNAHVLLADTPPDRQTAPAAERLTELAVVAWAADLPGLGDRDAVAAWVRGTGPGPQPSFGPSYRSAARGLRIPPPTQRVLDRCQLMVVACAEQLRGSLGAHWDTHRERLAVVLGHMGPTRSAISYAKRCYLDDVLGAQRPAALTDELVDAVRRRVHAEIPASTEDSFPGMMPNVIAARVSNYFDLHGPNMVVDTGFTSTESAFEVARRYLADGDADLAIVGGVNGNSTPEIHALLQRSYAVQVPVHEAAVLFAVTTPARAHDLGLPVLARVVPGETAPPGPTYLGADGAVATLRRTLGEATPVDVPPVTAAPVAPAPADVPPVTAAPLAPAPADVPPVGVAPLAPAPVTVRRHVARLSPVPASPELAELPELPELPGLPELPELPLLPADAVVVTATPDALGDLGDRAGDPLVLSSVPCPAGVRRRHVATLDADSVRGLIAELAPAATGVRAVTDLASALPAAGATEGDWSPVAALHDLLFLAIQAVSPRLDSLLGVFLGAVDGSVPHPFAGLFAGLFKSAALEFPQARVRCVLTSTHLLATGLRELATEARCEGELPVTVHRDGIRHVVRVVEEAAEPLAVGDTGRPGPDDVVVAVGGGHGITAELLRGVVSRGRPTIYILGSTDLDGQRAELAAVGGPAALADGRAFLRARLAAQPGQPVAAVNAALERLRRAAGILDTLAELERRCGDGRVHYRQADVTDRARVAAVVAEIHDRHERVDLLIHAAGLNRAGALATKPLSAFRAVREVKVGGYCALRAAFADRPPRRWCSFGSFIGLTGQLGEADYASANDFLATAAEAARHEGRDETAIGWTLWDDVGMGAHPVTRSFLARSGVLTRMSSAEGLRHFEAELTAANRSGAVYHLGAAERAAIARRVPAVLGNPSATATPRADQPRSSFYLDRVLARTDEHLVAERQFTSERDGYLAGHTVGGVGTLPGLFVPEIAAEAALALVPGLVVTGFRDISFERFLKLTPALTATPRRIHAKVTARSADAALVRVEVRGDVVAPGGRVLQADVRHFGVTTVLASDYPSAPRWAGLGDGPQLRLIDPYHAPGAPVELHAEFVTTTDTRIHPLGKLGSYRSPVAAGHPVYDRFVVPSLLLDGLARVGVLGLVAGRYIPVAAPAAIRRIDLYEAGSDVELGVRHGALDLTATPSDLDLEDAEATNRFVASRHDGLIVAQLHDVRGVVLGYVDAQTGARADRADVEGLAAHHLSPLPPVAL